MNHGISVSDPAHGRGQNKMGFKGPFQAILWFCDCLIPQFHDSMIYTFLLLISSSLIFFLLSYKYYFHVSEKFKKPYVVFVQVREAL